MPEPLAVGERVGPRHRLPQLRLVLEVAPRCRGRVICHGSPQLRIENLARLVVHLRHVIPEEDALQAQPPLVSRQQLPLAGRASLPGREHQRWPQYKSDGQDT